jgi:hypothetical protein
MDVLDGYTLTGRLWIFIGFQWTMVTIQMVVAYLIPDVPDNVEVQLQRQQFYVSKAIDMTPDEMEESHEEDAVSPDAGLTGDLMNAFTSGKQPKKTSHFDKKYANVPDIPIGGHPMSTSLDTCLSNTLQGPGARDKLVPPVVTISSSAELDARYGPKPTAAVDTEDVHVGFSTSAPTSPAENYQQVNQTGDSDDEGAPGPAAQA